jgi:hypothetical protein
MAFPLSVVFFVCNVSQMLNHPYVRSDPILPMLHMRRRSQSFDVVMMATEEKRREEKVERKESEKKDRQKEEGPQESAAATSAPPTPSRAAQEAEGENGEQEAGEEEEEEERKKRNSEKKKKKSSSFIQWIGAKLEVSPLLLLYLYMRLWPQIFICMLQGHSLRRDKQFVLQMIHNFDLLLMSPSTKKEKSGSRLSRGETPNGRGSHVGSESPSSSRSSPRGPHPRGSRILDPGSPRSQKAPLPNLSESPKAGSRIAVVDIPKRGSRVVMCESPRRIESPRGGIFFFFFFCIFQWLIRSRREWPEEW